MDTGLKSPRKAEILPHWEKVPPEFLDAFLNHTNGRQVWSPCISKALSFFLDRKAALTGVAVGNTDWRLRSA